jgi:opacity protein-like surface antigen
VKLNDDWKLKGFADWGGAGSGEESWQVYMGASYAINERWSTEAGYRHLEISKDVKGRDVSLNVSGPLIGFSYNF